MAGAGSPSRKADGTSFSPTTAGGTLAWRRPSAASRRSSTGAAPPPTFFARSTRPLAEAGSSGPSARRCGCLILTVRIAKPPPKRRCGSPAAPRKEPRHRQAGDTSSRDSQMALTASSSWFPTGIRFTRRAARFCSPIDVPARRRTTTCLPQDGLSDAWSDRTAAGSRASMSKRRRRMRVRILAFGPTTASATTDAEGYFEIGGLSSGTVPDRREPEGPAQRVQPVRPHGLSRRRLGASHRHAVAGADGRSRHVADASPAGGRPRWPES